MLYGNLTKNTLVCVKNCQVRCLVASAGAGARITSIIVKIWIRLRRIDIVLVSVQCVNFMSIIIVYVEYKQKSWLPVVSMTFVPGLDNVLCTICALP